MNLTAAERRLRRLLNFLVFVFLLATFLYELGPLIGPFKNFCRQLPFVSNSVVKVNLMLLLCLYAAGNVRKRIGLVLIFIMAHIASVAAMIVFLLIAVADISRIVQFGPWTTAIGSVLWGAIVLDGSITLVVSLFYLNARRSQTALESPAATNPGNPGHELTKAELWLERALIVFGFIFSLAAVGYELGPLLPSIQNFFIELPFVSNSVVKVATLAMISFYIAKDIRRNMSLASLLIVGHIVSAVAQIIFLLATDTGYTVRLGTQTQVVGNILWGSIALDGGIALILLLFYQSAWKARFNPRFLRPTEYRTLIALAEVLVRGADEKVPPADIASNVDGHISQIRARRRWVYRVVLFGVQLHPLLYFKAPFSELDEETRLRHLKTHFYKAVILRLIPDWWRRLVQAMIRVGKQLTYVGYYNDPRTFKSVGYVPFSQRERYKKLDIPEPKPHPLKVETPSEVIATILETDVCIIGSGAAGAILAYYLAKAGRKVLVLERGKYVEPREFSEDEVEMIGKLYADGVFQQTQDFRFTVLQGSCVGGSTTMNNAVCFEPPEHVLNRWNDPHLHDAGLNLRVLRNSVDEITRFLSIGRQDGVRLNPSYPKYVEGVKKLNLNLEVDVVRANIKGCFGCGYCNIGCAFGKKLSMLDTALPWAQRDFPGRVRILSECEVLRIRTLSGPIRRVSDIRATLSDGRKIAIRAKTYVLSAGAIASSYLLLRSGIGRQLPVGKHLCFNLGSYLTAEFDEVLNAYDGLQISHFGLPDPKRGFVYEVWWNPPTAQAVNMPGWFEDHYKNMQNYNKMMAVGVLVGTKGNAQVKQALTGGADIDYVPDKEDLKKLANGLKELGHILFAAGARRVMPNTWGYDVFTDPKELDKLDQIALDPSYITLGTGHPQGGNAISKDPRRGVVGPDFRVHGYSNLYVCDASVFPSSLTVNPQLTIMGLAHYAASRIK